MEKRIQKIINDRIDKKIELIKNMSSNNIYKDKVLTLIVDEDNVKSQYVKAIQSTFKKYLPKAIIKFVYVEKNMDRSDITRRLIEEVDILNELNGYLFIQPSITHYNTIPLKGDLDNIGNYNDLWNKYNLSITSQVIGEIIEDYIRDIDRPNIVIIGDGKTVGRPLNIWCQQNSNWNTYQIKECFKEKEDELDVYENGLNLRYKLLTNADIIVSATGVPNSLVIRDKVVISPTIFYDERTQRFQNDLEELCRDKCDTHTILNSIGTLTNLELCLRWLNEVLGFNSQERFVIEK